MANIKKIVSDEIEKVKLILSKSKNIYWNGTEQFNDLLNNMLIGTFNSDFDNFIKQLLPADYPFLILKDDIKMSQSYKLNYKLITIFSVGGLFFIPIEGAFWKNYKPYHDLMNEKPFSILKKGVLSFDDVEKITCENQKLQIEIKNNTEIFILDPMSIFPNNENKNIIDCFIDLILSIFKSINDEDNILQTLCSEINECYENNNWTRALESVNRILTIYPENLFCMTVKSETLMNLKNYEASYNLLKIIIEMQNKNVDKDVKKWSDNDRNLFAKIKRIEAELLKNKSQYTDALHCYNEAISVSNDKNEKFDLIGGRNNVQELIVNNIQNLRYSLRKVIYIDNELPLCNLYSILPLELKNINNLQFPPSHPVSGQLYVGHPFKEDLYYPFEDYENYLFESQVMELSYLLKSLGAIKIKTEHYVMTSQDDYQTNSTNIVSQNANQNNVKGSSVIYNGEISVNTDRNNHSQLNTNTTAHNIAGKRMNIDGVFTPKYKPFVPNDLVWYEHNEIWQSIAKQRIDGGLTSYDITLSMKNVEQISEKEIKKIDEEYKFLLKGNLGAKVVKLNFDIHQESNNSEYSESLIGMKKNKTTELRIIVDFAPIEELTLDFPCSSKQDNESNNQQTIKADKLNNAENEYVELLNDFIEDGRIADSFKKVLEKKRLKLNISEEKAKELEYKIISNYNIYSAAEIQYVSELKDILEIEEIDNEQIRKVLNKLGNRLNITAKRAQELENIALKH